MNIRRATMKDLDQMMEIIQQAQKYMAELKIDQWKGGYPNRELLVEDVKKNACIVWVEDEELICGMMTLLFEEEPSYRKLSGGEWKTPEPYAVIHRLAVREEYRGTGLAAEAFICAENLCREKEVYSLRIDTHTDNKPMRKRLEKMGYRSCGIVCYYKNNGEPMERIAYEKRLI